MDTPRQTVTPLRQRMTEDMRMSMSMSMRIRMRMRKLRVKTLQACIRAVRKLTACLNRSPATATATATVEDLRNFQLHRGDSDGSPITLNAMLSGLRYFVDSTLGRVELVARMQPVTPPRTVPVVASTQEATRLVVAACNVKPGRHRHLGRAGTGAA